MKMIPVNSKSIHSIGYENGILIVKFITGKSYTHENIPQNVFNGLINAASKGRYYNTFIRGKY